MTHIFERIGLAGPAMERIIARQRNVSTREEAPVFTPELAARAQRLYKRDFELFGYDTQSWQGI
jgi:hypothetical protein